MKDYHRAAHDTAPLKVWEDVLLRFQDMHFWVAHNKTIPTAIIDQLLVSPDDSVRAMIARKRKISRDHIVKLSADESVAVRIAVAANPKTPEEILLKLLKDPWAGVREIAARRFRK